MRTLVSALLFIVTLNQYVRRTLLVGACGHGTTTMNKTTLEEVPLPVSLYKDTIIDAVKHHDVVVITAQTGAGKSTLVPRYLLEEGYRVVVTQPRRLAARSLAHYVADSIGETLGETIGYRTAYEANDSDRTKVLFCTDGLELVRELAGYSNKDVLIIDEVHEWNCNIETLIAWTREQKRKGRRMKIVIMSATLEADRLVYFYGGTVPVIRIPGRSFKVSSFRDDAWSLVEHVRTLIDQGKNVLVFQPGKKEIRDTIESLHDSDAVALPLHAGLSIEEQDQCFGSYKKPKVIVSTNIAQTSITVPDIDAVVDNGEERIIRVVNGTEGLYLSPVSLADLEQRKGRVGRTKEGVYIMCSDVSPNLREEFPKAEIERIHLDQLVLRLMAVGIDATKLRFFHQPNLSMIREAKKVLCTLGAVTKDDRVTDIGYMMARLPVSVRYARMLIEAEKLRVLGDMLSIAAILEVNGLRDPEEPAEYLGNEKDADIFAELELWTQCEKMSYAGEEDGMYSFLGVSEKAYLKAREIRENLAIRMRDHDLSSNGNKGHILRAYVSGMTDHIYRRTGQGGLYQRQGNGSGEQRELSRESVVSQHTAPLVVGMPFDIQYRDKRGRLCVIHLLTMAARVTQSLLSEIAPHMVFPFENGRGKKERRKRRAGRHARR